MYRKLIPFLTITCLLTVYITAEERSFSFGGKSGWDDSAQYQHVVTQSEFNNTESLVLATQTVKTSSLDDNDDLVITFDQNIEDITKHYTIETNAILLAPEGSVHRGSGTGLATPSITHSNQNGGIAVRGNKEAFFGTEGTKGSFTIDFWLYPFVAENGEQILSWRTSRINRQKNTKMISQFIRASVFRNRIEWGFENVFFSETGAPNNITFSAYDILVPEKWAHHSLAFDEETGLIEYKIDGHLEAVAYVTNTKTEQGKPHTLILGTPSTLEICKAFSGMIDSFRIRKAYYETEPTSRFNRTGGRIVLPTTDTKFKGSECTMFTANEFIPEETATEYFIRSGDNVYTWTDTEPEWITVTPGEKLTGITGRFFQCAAELYTNGNADKTPVISEMTVTCTINDPPWPPVNVNAIAYDSAVTLTWDPSGSEKTKGYFVFYGDKPGEYFGKEASEGISPIQIETCKQSITLTGLKNGKIYYFAVAAYEKEEQSTQISKDCISKEVFARPKRTSGMRNTH